jgi:hypothetical protein
MVAHTATRQESHRQRHQCLIYGGAPSRCLDSLAHTIVEKLNSNHRCLYLNSPAMVAGMRSRLLASGLDLTKYLERGDLILSSDQGHLVNGKFDVDGMISLLSDAVRQAVADGYTGLWATGDMTWEFGSEKNLDKLLEYEQRLEEFMENNPALSGVCQYHRDTLPREAVLSALETHQMVYVDSTLSWRNPEYRPAGSGL